MGSSVSIIVSLCASISCSYETHLTILSLCWTSETRCAVLSSLLSGSRIAATTLSVALHILSLVFVRNYLKKTRNQRLRAVKIDKLQLNITLMAAYSCFAMAAFYVLSFVWILLKNITGMSTPKILATIDIIVLLNSIPKAYIVHHCSREIRKGVYDLISRIFSRSQDSVFKVPEELASDGSLKIIII
ncbi:unnamed protein product [Thelazia callipaeda]|uniref:G_PROTEIN_RECEP_F1_2 domain-containing protein n=1 Tax=Thelazia callipaeda TaxID=103827 RepID=A0A0N5CPC1_THECL|nr:unnamed protein product [Thelazia callipaeda]